MSQLLSVFACVCFNNHAEWRSIWGGLSVKEMEAEHSKTICRVKLGRWFSLLIFFYIFFRYHSVVPLRNHLSLFLPFISLFTGSCLFVAWLFLVSLKSLGQRRMRGLWISLWWTLLSRPWWFTWTQMPSCGWSTPFPYWYSTSSLLPFDAKIQSLISLFEWSGLYFSFTFTFLNSILLSVFFLSFLSHLEFS